MKKILIFAAFAVGALSNNSVHSMETLQNNTMVKVVGTGLGACALLYTTHKLSENKRVKGICKSYDVHPKALSNLINLSGGLLCASLFTNKDTSQVFREFAWKAPLIASIFVATHTARAKEFLSWASFDLGEYITCSRPHPSTVDRMRNEEIKKIQDDTKKSEEEKAAEIVKVNKKAAQIKTCTFGCERCQLTGAVTIVGLWKFATQGCPILIDIIKQKLFSHA